ncbi:MAG: response regulator [Gemmatimonadota bacterium]
MRFEKALVVDDERASRVVLRHVLELSGLDVVMAENGEEALDLIRTTSPDLVVTDLRMPGINGVQMVQQLKQERNGPLPTLVAVTRHPEDARSMGLFDLILKKPVSAARLIQWVRNGPGEA